jgi:ABC-2 type transport system permease protein
MTAYRAEMIIWILSATLPLVMLALWNAAAADGPLAGFGQADFARYFAVTLIVRQLTSAWVVWELNEMIRTGSLSPALLRPMNPLWLQFAETIAAVPWRMLVLAPILVGLGMWRPDVAFLPSLPTILGFGASVVLALLVGWFVQCVFGLLAFWVDQSTGLFQVYFFVWGLLGGYIVPLPLLPPSIGRVAMFLPFHATLGAPVEIALGLAPIGPTLLVQAGWAVVLAALASLVWQRGLRRYGAVGA